MRTGRSPAAPAAAGHHDLLAVTGHIGNDLLRIVIDQERARWNPHNQMLGVRPVLAFVAALYAAVGLEVPLIPEIHQGAQPFIHPEDDVSSAASIAAGRSAFRHIFLPAERYEAVSAVSAFT